MLPAQDRDFVCRVLEETSLARAIAGLEGHSQSAAQWSRLYMVLGGFALPSEFSQRLERIILNTDFAATASDEIGTGHIPLHIACVQAKNMPGQTARLNLVEATCAVAGVFANHRDLTNAEDVAFVLLDCALSLAHGTSAGVLIMDEFASIAERLVGIWSLLGKVARSGIQRLCEEVPYAESERLWRLNLVLRART